MMLSETPERNEIECKMILTRAQQMSEEFDSIHVACVIIVAVNTSDGGLVVQTSNMSSLEVLRALQMEAERLERHLKEGHPDLTQAGHA